MKKGNQGYWTMVKSVLIVATCCCYLQQGMAQTAPNIIFILTDDQGWSGTSLQMMSSMPNSKSDFYLTPNVERLAATGMTFSQGYAPAPKCSPTRNSILTGQTPAKTKMTTTGNGTATGKILVAPMISPSIDPTKITLPELIKQIDPNYITAHYGKWHLGQIGPDGHGFDRQDGANGNNSGNAADGQSVQTDPKKIFTLTDSAMALMDDAVAANRPFYLQVSHYAVHTAQEATQATLNIYNDPTQRPPGVEHNAPLYGAMTEDLDKGVGMLLDKLDSLGIADNTYIIYMSDNGAQNGQSNNNPLTGSKVFLTEGGIRVPFLIVGPNIAANSRNAVPVVGYDLYPTIIEWIEGNTAAVPTEVEGTSLVPILTGAATTLTRTHPIVFHSPHYDTTPSKKPSSAIVQGNYKLYVNYQNGNFKLHDLNVDITESNNLFSTLPTVANDLCLQLRDYLKSINADMPTLDDTHANNTGTSPDADNDGLDDVWEFRELLTVGYDGTDDPDNDNLTNAQEFANGTDPYTFTTGTQNLSAQYSIGIFPNPVKEELNIRLPSELANQKILITITNIFGQNLGNFSTTNKSLMTVNTTDYPKGVLVVSFRNEQGILVGIKKVVK